MTEFSLEIYGSAQPNMCPQNDPNLWNTKSLLSTFSIREAAENAGLTSQTSPTDHAIHVHVRKMVYIPFNITIYLNWEKW